MAPLEIEYGVHWEDEAGDGFLNHKEKLPIRVKPGKSIKRTLKEGKTILKLEAKCDKRDKGGSVKYNVKWPSKNESNHWYIDDIIVIGLGQTDGMFVNPEPHEEYDPPSPIGFIVRHVGTVLLNLERTLKVEK